MRMGEGICGEKQREKRKEREKEKEKKGIKKEGNDGRSAVLSLISGVLKVKVRRVES